jgi:hypothetical protein
MKRIGALVLAGLMMSCVGRAETSAGDPAEVTKAAYQVDLKHFGFDADTVRADKPYLAPDLYAALMKKAHQPVAKGDAPDIEGDVLFDAQDVPDKYEVGVATIRGPIAEVPASFYYGKEKRHFTVHLVQFKDGWKISDIDYGKDGKLSDLLK